MFNSLDQLALKHGSDKSSAHHNYCPIYEEKLGYLRMEQNKILEIGFGGYHHLDRGGAGLRTWAEYFRYSTIVSIDIHEKDFTPPISSAFTFFRQGSQTDPEFLFTLTQEFGPFNIIIDDGSHTSPNTTRSFEILWPTLQPAGWYIIEDLEASYWDDEEFKGGLHNGASTVNFVKDLVDTINHKHSGVDSLGIKSIHFFEKIVFIQKNYE
jgi:hypothetical protein